jgi:hypothetical protein
MLYALTRAKRYFLEQVFLQPAVLEQSPDIFMRRRAIKMRLRRSGRKHKVKNLNRCATEMIL